MAQVSTKREAQQRVDRIHAFRRELAEVVRDGILVLSLDQQARLYSHLDKTLQELASRFDVDISESQKQISLGMRIVSTLGGLAFCAAIFLFFYRFWGVLSTPAQVAILVAAPVVGLLSMEFAARRERTLYYTGLLALVVLAAFALDLIEIGNIFNMLPSPGAFLVWALLALILAYTYGLRLPLAGGLLALAVYLAAVITSLAGYFWAADQMPENYLAVGLAMTALPFVVRHRNLRDFPTIYRGVGLLIVFLSVLVLGNAGQISWLPFAAKTIQGVYQIAGMVVTAAAIWLGIRHRLPWSVNLGSAFFAIYLFNRMFSWWWEWMPKYLFFFILGVIAVALLAMFRKIRSRIDGVGACEAKGSLSASL